MEGRAPEAARGFMHFNLDGFADDRPNVPTDAYSMAQARAAVGRARANGGALASSARANGGALASAARANGGVLAARGSVLAQSAASTGADRAKAAGAAAMRNGAISLKKARAMKKRFHNWLYNRPDTQNFFLFITNTLYLALTLTALVLTFLVVQEHVDDFKRNEYTQHRKPDGTVKRYPPCGMPTPDSMYLLQAIGALPAAGWDGASLEPDYQNWMQKVDRALCSRIIPGAAFQPTQDYDMSVCENDGLQVTYQTEHVEELLALGYLMDDSSITPTSEDFQDQELVREKRLAFERRACLVKEGNSNYPDENPYYSEQQRESYGDLKTRVARAYIAAMPAFARYQRERDLCAIPDEYKDPFDTYCKHSCHVRNELKAASEQQDLLYVTGTVPGGATFTKQLYRLLALSLAGYYDRYENDGACFRNTEVYAEGHANEGDRFSAHDFCSDSLSPSTGGDKTTFTNAAAMAEYTAQNELVERGEQCGNDGYAPPPPAPPVRRSEPGEGEGDKLSAQVCAGLLQYGLFEQGRLFGIPDVVHPFVLDNRVHPSIHFVGAWIYNAMYVNPVKMAGDILADPKSKLEMYIAYRLSSTSIWAILVANVAGYMMVRALAPMIVHILKLTGFKTNVIKYKDPEGPYKDIYEDIVLVRPQIGWPMWLAMGVTVLAVYWILFIDPATQSHYYITPTCEDWQGLGVHVPSGAFGTTWGKRRYGRFGEHLIGVLLAITLVLILLVIGVGKTFVPDVALKEASKVKMGTTARLDGVALVMIGFALVIQLLFIVQSLISGDAWYQSVKASDNDAVALDVFSKDVWMSIWAAFWTSASIAWYRQKWAVDKLNFLLQLAWMASALLLLWMPVFQSAVLLEKEIDVAFSDGKGTKDTNRLIVCIFIYAFSAIWTAILGIRLKAMWDAIPERAAALANSAARVTKAKYDKRMYIEGIEAAAAQVERDNQARAAFGPDGLTFAPGSRLKFDLSAVRVGPAGTPVMPVRLGRKTEAVYMPLMPKH